MLMNLSNSWTLLFFPRAEYAVSMTDVIFGALVTGGKYRKLMS